MGRRWGIAVVVVLFTSGACDDDAALPGATCRLIGDICVGLPSEPVCGSGCTEGVSCATTFEAATEGDLATAIANAQSGDCIVLAAGTYPATTVPGGVSLLGQGAEHVQLGPLVVDDGTGATLRGLHINGGLDAGSATELTIEAVRTSGGDIGLRAGPGASVTITQSEIHGAANFGVLGAAPASVTLRQSILGDGQGLWVSCVVAGAADQEPCNCAARPSIMLDHVLIERPTQVGLSLSGSDAALDHVLIRDVQQGADARPGVGLAASGCSSLGYANLAIDKAGGAGLLLDHASMRPGLGFTEKGIIVVDTKPGIWIQATDETQEAMLEGVSVDSCGGAGIGFDLAARGIIVVDTKVANTRYDTQPVESGGVSQVGLGLVWKAGSTASITGLTITTSDDRGFVIDGPAGPGSSLSSITLAGGDETDGILQQNVENTTDAPAVGAGSPAVTQAPNKLTEIPTAPAGPS